MFAILWLILLKKLDDLSYFNMVRIQVLIIVICSVILSVVTFLMICLGFDRHGRSWVRKSRQNDLFMMKYRRRWERRFNFWFCCVRSEKHKPILEIANLFSAFFLETDRVITDFAIGFILLKLFQKQKRLVDVKVHYILTINVTIIFNPIFSHRIQKMTFMDF